MYSKKVRSMCRQTRRAQNDDSIGGRTDHNAMAHYHLKHAIGEYHCYLRPLVGDYAHVKEIQSIHLRGAYRDVMLAWRYRAYASGLFSYNDVRDWFNS